MRSSTRSLDIYSRSLTRDTRSLMRIGVLVVGGVREWRRVPKIGVSTHLRPMGPSVIADLDTLLIALYVELTDQIIPTRPNGRRAGPGRPPALTDAELVCLAVEQVLLRYDDEHHWLRAAPARVGHLFPRLLSQPADNRRLRAAPWLPEAGLARLARAPPAPPARLRLLDGPPGSCGRSRTTATRSGLAGWAGYGHDTSHHCCYLAAGCGWAPPPGGRGTGAGRAGRAGPATATTPPTTAATGQPAAAGHHPGGDGDRVRAGQPQAAGRTRGGGGQASKRSRPT